MSSLYFIQAGDFGPVKVGVAKNPLKRVEELQTGNHCLLRLRATFQCDDSQEARSYEQAIHAAFRDLQTSGGREWRFWHPDLERLIVSVHEHPRSAGFSFRRGSEVVHRAKVTTSLYVPVAFCNRCGATPSESFLAPDRSQSSLGWTHIDLSHCDRIKQRNDKVGSR